VLLHILCIILKQQVIIIVVSISPEPDRSMKHWHKNFSLVSKDNINLRKDVLLVFSYLHWK
jgi:hypothetical protein